MLVWFIHSPASMLPTRGHPTFVWLFPNREEQIWGFRRTSATVSELRCEQVKPSGKSEGHEAPGGEHSHVTATAPVCQTASEGGLREGGRWVSKRFSCARGLPCYWRMFIAASEGEMTKLWISCLERENTVEQWNWGMCPCVCICVHCKHLYRGNEVITVLEHVGAVFVPVPLLRHWRGDEAGGLEATTGIGNLSPAVAKSRCEGASTDVL